MNFPFNEPQNTAVITCCHIIDGNSDILFVSHDGNDGMWQFLCGETHIQEEARVVSLNEIFMLDNTLAALANLPCGYVAERIDKATDWIIKKR